MEWTGKEKNSIIPKLANPGLSSLITYKLIFFSILNRHKTAFQKTIRIKDNRIKKVQNYTSFTESAHVDD